MSAMWANCKIENFEWVAPPIDNVWYFILICVAVPVAPLLGTHHSFVNESESGERVMVPPHVSGVAGLSLMIPTNFLWLIFAGGYAKWISALSLLFLPCHNHIDCEETKGRNPHFFKNLFFGDFGILSHPASVSYTHLTLPTIYSV